VTIPPSSGPIAFSVPPTISPFYTVISLIRLASRSFSSRRSISRCHVTNGWRNYAILIAGTLIIDGTCASLACIYRRNARTRIRILCVPGGCIVWIAGSKRVPYWSRWQRKRIDLIIRVVATISSVLGRWTICTRSEFTDGWEMLPVEVELRL